MLFVLREESRYGVDENWVVKVIFGSKNKSNRKLEEKCI